MFIYQVMFGFYKTEVFVFCSNIELESERQLMGKGSFGKIYKMSV